MTEVGRAGLPEVSESLENREPLDTRSMLENAFLQNLRATNGSTAAKIANSPGNVVAKPIDGGTEKLLIDLYEVRDGLIETFEGVDYDSVVGKNVANNINKVSQCINRLGGDAPEFISLNHVSGLAIPNVSKNADRVLETTRQCYRFGKVKDATYLDDSKSIQIVFCGTKDDICYEATGTMTAARGWVGNEAIDYIYSKGSGRMSVKAFEKGRWTDKSNEDDYNIYWELNESSIIKEAGKKDKSIEIKEEDLTDTQNDLNKKDNDFPIEDK